MKINELYDKFYQKAKNNNPDALLPWINNLLKKNREDLDLRYLFLDILRWNNLDVEDDKEEPEVLKLCTLIIKNKPEASKITIAKAYTYRGEMRHYGIERRKDFDKARNILNQLPKKDAEVSFLNQFIDFQYAREFRIYLAINTNYLNMFTI